MIFSGNRSFTRTSRGNVGDRTATNNGLCCLKLSKLKLSAAVIQFTGANEWQQPKRAGGKNIPSMVSNQWTDNEISSALPWICELAKYPSSRCDCWKSRTWKLISFNPKLNEFHTVYSKEALDQKKKTDKLDILCNLLFHSRFFSTPK